ncbi:immunodominant staphylococcal antigen IsaB family protein [Salinicoccus sp. Marseille-QA3877]
MDKYTLLKALTSAGVAASLVIGPDAVNGEDEENTAEASETESQDHHYNYEGDTGYGDGSFILDSDFKKTLDTDGNLYFNGYNIEASEADYIESVKEGDFVEVKEVYDQEITLHDNSNNSTKVDFPIQNGELPIKDVIDVYGGDYEVHPGHDGTYETYVYLLGDQKDDKEKNEMALKVEDGHVTQGIIGYNSSY